MDARLKEMLPEIPGYEKTRWSISKWEDQWIIQIMTEYPDGWWGGAVTQAHVVEGVEANRDVIVDAAYRLLRERKKVEEEARKPKIEDLSGDY